MTSANKLYASYDLTSDPNDLPDEVFSFCAKCAEYPSVKILVELESTTAACNGCAG